MTPAGFLNEVIAWATPSRDARTLVSNQRARVEQHLHSDLGIVRMRETGSWTHGTAVDAYSDVDYFVSMPGSRPGTSLTSLTALRSSLQRGFPQAFVYTNRPAVTFRMSHESPYMEIVPAFYRSTDDYDIPDPTGTGWIRSNPVKHFEYVNRAQARDDKAKSLIRLIKTWRSVNQVPLASIYVELRTAKRVLDVPPVLLLWDVQAILANMSAGGLALMNDPSDYDGRRIHPGYNDPQERSKALAAVTEAARLAGLAKDAEHAGYENLAVTYLKQLFNVGR